MFVYEQETDVFPTVKPMALLRRLLRLATPPHGRPVVLDFFAGSASTAHSLINLNREDGGTRRFVLVEQSRHVLVTALPRIMKAIYCPSWKDGRPQDYPSPSLFGWPEWVQRSPRLIQVVRLESFEDSLHNVVLKEPGQQTGAVNAPARSGTRGALRYRVSPSLSGAGALFDGACLARPFSTTLDALTGAGLRPERVDLVETFNALCGLRVERVERWLDAPAGGTAYCAVIGLLGEASRTLILWRDGPPPDPQRERAYLAPRLQAFDTVLINGAPPVPGMLDLIPLFGQLMEEPAALPSGWRQR
jgi:adenine-specific DNA-methyltransferase